MSRPFKALLLAGLFDLLAPLAYGLGFKHPLGGLIGPLGLLLALKLLHLLKPLLSLGVALPHVAAAEDRGQDLPEWAEKLGILNEPLPSALLRLLLPEDHLKELRRDAAWRLGWRRTWCRAQSAASSLT